MTNTTLLDLLSDNNAFATRHNGPDSAQQKTMLETIGLNSLDQLIDQTVPAAIRLPKKMQLAEAQSEAYMLSSLKTIAKKNVVKTEERSPLTQANRLSFVTSLNIISPKKIPMSVSKLSQTPSFDVRT